MIGPPPCSATTTCTFSPWRPAYGRLRERDSFTDVLEAPDRDLLIDWLRRRPILVYDAPLQTLLVHAGVHPSWNRVQALALAGELQDTLRSEDYRDFLQRMYGNHPLRWEPDLGVVERQRFVTNVLTRIRYVDPYGHLDFEHSGSPGTQPGSIRPWFEVPDRPTRSLRVVFGHWSTLGLQPDPNIVAIDTGCVWGGRLTAARLDPEPLRYIHVSCGTTPPAAAGRS